MTEPQGGRGWGLSTARGTAPSPFSPWALAWGGGRHHVSLGRLEGRGPAGSRGLRKGARGSGPGNGGAWLVGRKCEVASCSGARRRPRGGRGERVVVVRGAEVGSTGSHILHSLVDGPAWGRPAYPFLGPWEVSKVGLLGVAAWRELRGARDVESPMWAPVVAAGAGGQEGGLCRPTAGPPSMSLAGLQPSRSSSFSLSPSSLNPPHPIWPCL